MFIAKKKTHTPGREGPLDFAQWLDDSSWKLHNYITVLYNLGLGKWDTALHMWRMQRILQYCRIESLRPVGIS